MKRKVCILLICVVLLLVACVQEESERPAPQEQNPSSVDNNLARHIPEVHYQASGSSGAWVPVPYIPEVQPEALHIFHDEAVRKSVERFFDKEAD